jgi:hypothetical protein
MRCVVSCRILIIPKEVKPGSILATSVSLMSFLESELGNTSYALISSLDVSVRHSSATFRLWAKKLLVLRMGKTPFAQ